MGFVVRWAPSVRLTEAGDDIEILPRAGDSFFMSSSFTAPHLLLLRDFSNKYDDEYSDKYKQQRSVAHKLDLIMILGFWGICVVLVNE